MEVGGRFETSRNIDFEWAFFAVCFIFSLPEICNFLRFNEVKSVYLILAYSGVEKPGFHHCRKTQKITQLTSA